MEEALGRVVLLVLPRKLPAQASKEMGTFFSDKQQQMLATWPGLQAGTREQAEQDYEILILKTRW